MRYLLSMLLSVAACGTVKELPDGGGMVTGPQTLTVTVTAGGSVTSTPAGITCGPTCSAMFDANASVTLTATAEATSAFVGWSGDCAGSGPCSVTMDGAKAVTATFAPHGSKRWVEQIGFSGFDSIEKVVVDKDGNAIVGGVIVDDAGGDLYIVKYAKEDGHIVWKQRLVTQTAEDLGGLATDADGNIYLATRLSIGSATFGTTAVTGDLFGNIVVLRLAAATGEVVWAKQWGGNGQDIPEAVAVSGNDLYVVGNTSSMPATFDALSFTASTNNGFVVRANIADGRATAAKLLAGSVSLRDVAVNGTDVAVVGDARSNFTIDANCGIAVAGAGTDAMIIDLTGATLGCRWARTYGDFIDDHNASISGVAAFPGGGWAIIGDFQGNILLAPSGTSLTSHGMFDVFAGRFTVDGAHVWSFRYGEAGFDLGETVAVTPAGNTILAGVFDTSITFGATTVMGKSNAFVTRMSAATAPTHEWAVSLGGDDTDSPNSVALGPDGTVYVVAGFTGMTTIGGTALTSTGDYDAWVAALVP